MPLGNKKRLSIYDGPERRLIPTRRIDDRKIPPVYKAIFAILGILFVMIVAQQYQMSHTSRNVDGFNDKVVTFNDKVTAAIAKSNETNRLLNQILTDLNTPGRTNAAASAAAVQAIPRIEQAICHGKCPEVPTTTTTTRPSGG